MRHQLQTFSLRLKALEKQVAEEGPGVDREPVGSPAEEERARPVVRGRSRLPIPAIWAPRTSSMSAPSKGWDASMSKPSSIPTEGGFREVIYDEDPTHRRRVV